MKLGEAEEGEPSGDAEVAHDIVRSDAERGVCVDEGERLADQLGGGNGRTRRVAFDEGNRIAGRADVPEPEPEPEPVIREYAVNLADYSNVINVQTAWGVVEGADVSDDVETANTTAINRGIAAAASGSTVYFPSGNYRVNAAIAVTEKTRLTLLGDHATLLRSGTDNTLASDWSSQILSISYCSTPVTVKGFTLRYESDTSWSGIIAAKGVRIEDNVFGNLSSNAVSRSMTQCAIYLHNCSNVIRSNNVGAEPGREYGGYRVITE